MKKLLFSLLFLSVFARAETTKTVYNPFTNKLDFITSMDGSSWPSSNTSGCLGNDGSGNLSWVSCSGASGTPGTPLNSVQFNNASSFAGDQGMTYAASTGLLVSTAIVSASAATPNQTAQLSVQGNTANNWSLQVSSDIVDAGTPGVYVSTMGSVYIGTAPATSPIARLTITDNTSATSTTTVLINPTWNNVNTSFTGILENVTNTASAAASDLMDLFVGSVDEFRVSKAGSIYAASFQSTDLSLGSTNVNYINRIFSSANSVGLYGGPNALGNGEIDAMGGTAASNPGGISIRTSTSSVSVSNTMGAGSLSVTVSSNGWVALSTGTAAATGVSNENSRFSIMVSTSNEKYAITIGTMTGTSNQGLYDVAITTSGHFTALADSPTISGCGTGPTGKWTDQWGWITPGSTAAGCTITFGIAYNNAPVCVVSERTENLVNALSYTVSATALTLTQTSMTSTFDYYCSGVGE